MKWVDLAGVLIGSDNELFGQLPDLQFLQLIQKMDVRGLAGEVRTSQVIYRGAYENGSYLWNQAGENNPLILMQNCTFS